MIWSDQVIGRQRLGAAGDATRIFISHSSTDGDVAKTMAHFLRGLMGARWHVFNSADACSMYPGLPWEHTLTAQLDKAHIVILLLSTAALESRWVKREFESAVVRGIPIYPMLVSTLPPTELPSAIARLQPRRLTEAEDVQALVRDLRADHRKIQRLNSRFWTRSHELMNADRSPVDLFLRELAWIPHKNVLTLHPLSLRRDQFPSFGEYTSDAPVRPVPTHGAMKLVAVHSEVDSDVAALTVALIRRAFARQWLITSLGEAPEGADIDAVLLVLSADSVQSARVLTAYEEALESNIPVVPVLFGPLSTSALPPPYDWLQTRRLDQEEDVGSILHALRQLRREKLQRVTSFAWWLLDEFRGRKDDELSHTFVAVLMHHIRDTRGYAPKFDGPSA